MLSAHVMTAARGRPPARDMSSSAVLFLPRSLSLRVGTAPPRFAMNLAACPLPGAPLVPPPRLFTLRDGRSLAYSYFGVPLHCDGDATSHGPPTSSAGGAGAAAAAAPRYQPQHSGGASMLKPHARGTVIYFHGFCSSRLEAGLLHADALHHGLSVVAVDRPGAGHSTLNDQQASGSYCSHSFLWAPHHIWPCSIAVLHNFHSQTVESMAEDARQLLDHLGLGRVAVMGASGRLGWTRLIQLILAHALLILAGVWMRSGSGELQGPSLPSAAAPATPRLCLAQHCWPSCNPSSP